MSERNNMSIESKTYTALVLDEGSSWETRSPLHLTVTPPCMMSEAQAHEFGSLLRVDLHRFGAVDLIGEGEDWFGPAHTERVRRMARTAELLLLHQLAMDALEEIVPTVDTTYAYDKYQPHVTLKNGSGSFARGEHRSINELKILRKDPGSGLYTVSTTIPLVE